VIIILVAASSIIRPGVAQSGMMKTYIQNYHHPENVKYLHPVMEEQMKEKKPMVSWFTRRRH